MAASQAGIRICDPKSFVPKSRGGCPRFNKHTSIHPPIELGSSGPDQRYCQQYISSVVGVKYTFLQWGTRFNPCLVTSVSTKVIVVVAVVAVVVAVGVVWRDSHRRVRSSYLEMPAETPQ